MDTEWNQDDWDGCEWADYLMPNDYEQDGHQSRGDFGLLFFVGEYKKSSAWADNAFALGSSQFVTSKTNLSLSQR